MLTLNLGCGNQPLISANAKNHDIYKHRKEIDVCFDLNDLNWKQKVWEAFGNEVDCIIADDVIEHLDDPINFINQCWEILPQGGTLKMKACGWQNPNVYVDITHKRGFDIKSFDYFDQSTELGTIYSYYTDKKWKMLECKYDRHKNIIIKMSPIK